MHLCKFQTHSQMALEMIIRATFDGWSWLQNSVFTQSKTFVHKLLTNYNVGEPGVYSHKQMLKISPIWGPAYMARPKYGVQKPTLSTQCFSCLISAQAELVLWKYGANPNTETLMKQLPHALKRD